MMTELYDFGDGFSYYFIDDFFEVKHSELKGCRNGREYAKKQGFTYGIEYFIARSKKDEWIPLDENRVSCKDKVFIRSDCFVAITTTAPPIIELEDKEQLKSKTGKIKRIEVRGTRTKGGIYFKADDIAKQLGIKYLIYSVAKSDSPYDEGIHYCYFLIDNEKLMYLTYQGFLRAIGRSKTATAKQFQQWMADVIQIHHLGTKEQKQELAANLLNMKLDNLIGSLAFCRNKIAAVYVLNLGLVRDIKDKLSLPDGYDKNQMIRKYGMTDDLHRRLGEHRRDFRDKYGMTINVETYYPIDEKYIAHAETDVKHYMAENNYLVEHDYHVEFFTVEKKSLKDTLNSIEIIASKYSINSDTMRILHEKEIVEKEKRASEAIRKAKKKATKAIIEMKDVRIEMKDLRIENKDLRIEAMEREKILEDKIRELEKQLASVSKRATRN